jgi:uncharacterized protein (TIGR00297 family)
LSGQVPDMHQPPFLLFAIASAVIAFVTLFVHFAVRKSLLPTELGRKIVHFCAILVCAYVIAHTQERQLLAYVFFAATPLLFYLTHYNIILPSNRKSYGIALFPLAFGALMFSDLPQNAILFAVLTLGISDALAGYFGQRYAKQKIIFLAEPKSWLGFSVFFSTTLLIGAYFMGFRLELILLALVPALLELFSYRGSDNLTVPLGAAAWFAFLQGASIAQNQWICFFALTFFGYFVHRKRWLTETGIAAAVLLVIVLICTSGVSFLMPMLVFFAAGSLASKLHAKPKESHGRDAIQVFSNGLIAILCLCAYAYTHAGVFKIAYFASVCISLSDTISSDIGTYFKQKTYDVLTLKPTPVGISGGVSFAGTAAGVAAAVLFSLFMYFAFHLQHMDALLVCVMGVAGMLLDSVIGSKLQAKYLLNGSLFETPQADAHLVKGWAWLQNDWVNLISNALCVVVFVLVWG